MPQARRKAARARTAPADPLHVGSLHRVLLKLLMVLCWLLVTVAWFTAFTAAPLLPQSVPLHYGPSGVPDAFTTNTGAILYGLPLLSTALALAMVLLYLHPRYSNVPGTLLLDVLPERERRAVEAIVRANLVPAFTLINLLLVYLHFSMIAVALGNRERLDAPTLIALLVLLLLTGAFYIVVSNRMVGAIVRRVRR